MKRSVTGFVVMAVVAVAGCNNSTPGGPGAVDAGAKKPLYGQATETFDLSVPSLSTALKQGDAKECSIGIKRGKNFGETVTLTFVELPKGVTIEPASPVIRHGDTDAKFTLKAGDAAPTGDFVVKVTGHPTKGGDATSDFKVTVAQKDTFTLSVPFLSTSLKQGDTKAVSIGITRDKTFDQDVTLTFADMPKGVTLDPASSVIKRGEADAKFTLKGADDAALGDFAVKVTGHPPNGSDASNELKFTVAKK